MVQGARDGVDVAVEGKWHIIGFGFQVSGQIEVSSVRNQVSDVGCQVSVFAFFFPDIWTLTTEH